MKFQKLLVYSAKTKNNKRITDIFFVKKVALKQFQPQVGTVALYQHNNMATIKKSGNGDVKVSQ